MTTLRRSIKGARRLIVGCLLLTDLLHVRRDPHGLALSVLPHDGLSVSLHGHGLAALRGTRRATPRRWSRAWARSGRRRRRSRSSEPWRPGWLGRWWAVRRGRRVGRQGIGRHDIAAGEPSDTQTQKKRHGQDPCHPGTTQPKGSPRHASPPWSWLGWRLDVRRAHSFVAPGGCRADECGTSPGLGPRAEGSRCGLQVRRGRSMSGADGATPASVWSRCADHLKLAKASPSDPETPWVKDSSWRPPVRWKCPRADRRSDRIRTRPRYPPASPRRSHRRLCGIPNSTDEPWATPPRVLVKQREYRSRSSTRTGTYAGGSWWWLVVVTGPRPRRATGWWAIVKGVEADA